MVVIQQSACTKIITQSLGGVSTLPVEKCFCGQTLCCIATVVTCCKLGCVLFSLTIPHHRQSFEGYKDKPCNIRCNMITIIQHFD
jgi:hypothetical protein